MKVTVIHIVIGAFGIALDRLEKRFDEQEGRESIKITVLQKSFRKTLKSPVDLRKLTVIQNPVRIVVKEFARIKDKWINTIEKIISNASFKNKIKYAWMLFRLKFKY